MRRGMDWWTFGGADASIASTWFGLHHARLLSCCPSTHSGFEIWVFRFRVLGAFCFGLRFRNYPSLMTSITLVPVLHQPQVREQGTWISWVNITFISKLFAIFITIRLAFGVTLILLQHSTVKFPTPVNDLFRPIPIIFPLYFLEETTDWSLLLLYLNSTSL